MQSLMERFLAFGEGATGLGPLGPSPDERDCAERFLAAHPGLAADPTYTEFLLRYGGASVSHPAQDNERWVALLPGPVVDNRAVVPFTEEGYGVGKDGFLVVAQLFHQESWAELLFGYYLAGDHQPGLHRIDCRGEAELRGWYCGSFAEWLRRFVERGEAIFGE